LEKVMISEGMINFILDKFSVLAPRTFNKIKTFGLSNSTAWKVFVSVELVYVLKAYDCNSLENLRLSHRLMFHTFKNGFHFLPKVVQSNENDSVVFYGGYYWELTTWIEGSVPIVSTENLIQSVENLSKFHSAIDCSNVNFGDVPSWKIRLNEITCSRLSSLIVKNQKSKNTHILEKAFELLAWCLEEVPKILPDSLPQCFIQYCWGDARRENVLFQNDHFGGFIDFYSARFDCKEVDVSRLISSFALDDYKMWKEGLDVYRNFHEINYVICRKLDVLGAIVALKRWILWSQESVEEDKEILRLQRLGEVLQRVQKWKKNGSLKSILFFD